MTYDIMVYDIMTFDIMSYDIRKYYITTYEVMKYVAMTYDVMTYDNKTYKVNKTTRSCFYIPYHLYITSYHITSVYRVYGTQNNQLELMVSIQKSVLKNMHRFPRYRPKCIKFCWFGLEGQISTLFCLYLGTRCIFFKTNFCI